MKSRMREIERVYARAQRAIKVGVLTEWALPGECRVFRDGVLF